jgi:hypothetical protein
MSARDEVVRAMAERLQSRMTAPNMPVFAFEAEQAECIAKVALDAALASGLCILVDDLEQAGMQYASASRGGRVPVRRLIAEEEKP